MCTSIIQHTFSKKSSILTFQEYENIITVVMNINKEKRYKRKWREEHREHIRKYDKRYYAENGKGRKKKNKLK